MSNGIRDVEKLFNRQLETAKRKNERELKNMQGIHSSMKNELKKVQASEIVEIQDQHQRQINAESEKKEKVLSEMRGHLQKTAEMTDKELKALKQNDERQKIDHQKKLSEQRQLIQDNHQLYLEELNDRFSTQSEKVNSNGKNRIDEMKQEMHEQFANSEAFNQKRLNDQSNEFTTRFRQEGMNYKKLKDQQDNQFKKERLSTNTRQQVELGKLTTTHTKNIEERDTEFRKGLKEQDKFFEDKYKINLDRHNADFKTLEDKNKKVVADLKASLTKEITQVAEKKDDSFFEFTTLKPRLKKFEDRVEISLEIPEYAKNDLQLSTNIKEAIVSLNRRYTDANRTSDGVINKVKKVESFTTRIPTDVVLDAKSVKSTYEDGVMTYVIKKA